MTMNANAPDWSFAPSSSGGTKRETTTVASNNNSSRLPVTASDLKATSAPFCPERYQGAAVAKDAKTSRLAAAAANNKNNTYQEFSPLASEFVPNHQTSAPMIAAKPKPYNPNAFLRPAASEYVPTTAIQHIATTTTTTATPLCRFFLRGACRKGLDCPFQHDAGAVAPASGKPSDHTEKEASSSASSFEYFIEEGIQCTFGPGVSIDNLVLGNNNNSSGPSPFSTVSISGLPIGSDQSKVVVSEHDIEARLSPFGSLLRLSIMSTGSTVTAATMKKKNTNKPSWFALVTFTESTSANAAAAALHGSTVSSWAGIVGACHSSTTGTGVHERHRQEQFNNAVSVTVVKKEQSSSGISSQVATGVTVKVQWYAPSRCAWVHFHGKPQAIKAAKELNGKVLGHRKLVAKFQAPSFNKKTSFTAWIGNLGESVTEPRLKSFAERHAKTRVQSLSFGDLPFTEKTASAVVQGLLRRHGGQLISFEKEDNGQQQHDKANLKRRALVRFADARGAEQACRYFAQHQSIPDLGGSRLFLARVFSIKYTVPVDVFIVIEKELVARLKEGLASGLRYSVFENALSRTISIKADRAEDIASIKVKLDRLVQGEVVRDPDNGNRVLWNCHVRSSLFWEKFHKTLSPQITCCAWPDIRRQEVRVFGPIEKDRSLLIKCLLAHCKDEMIETQAVPIALNEFEYILQNGRSVLDNARRASKARKVSVDIKNRSLLVEGSHVEARQVKSYIHKLVHNLGGEDEEEALPSGDLCPVCFCPPEGEVVQSSCGHCYCGDCFDAWLAGGSLRDFPLVCLNQDCTVPIALGVLKESLDTPIFLGILRFSVDDHVRKHFGVLQFCVTPTCPGVYSITEGNRLSYCSTCSVAICTDCNIAHGELSCEEHRLATQPPDILRMKIVDEILTLRCPRCRKAFLDFDGCFALRCSVCPCGFCGWCLKDCGTDAHSHVLRCASKPAGAGTYFGTKQQFEAAQNNKRRHEVEKFLNSLSPADRRTTLVAIQGDLADLGIQLE